MYGYEIFHEKLMTVLLNNVKSGSYAHAYIFEGEKGLGKHNAAMLFAKTALCENTGSAPCGVCRSCIMAKAGTHPDIITVSAPKDKKSIGVDEIEKMSAEAHIKPFHSEKKVFIINSLDIVTEAAQNKMLKLIEEPPSYALFILVAESLAPVLQTTLSRCVCIHFPPVSEETVKKHIADKYPDISGEELDFYVKYSNGIPGAADELIADDEFIGLRQEALEHVSFLFASNNIYAYRLADFFEKNKNRADTVIDIWISFVRDMIAVQSGCSDSIINVDMKTTVSKAANRIEEKTAVGIMDRLLSAKKKLKRYVNTNAVIMTLALK